MKPSPSAYRRLPGRSFSLLHGDTAWIGEDHVLAVRAQPGSDAYRRFYFRDIEAIIVRPTSARLWTNVVLLGLTAIMALYGLVLVSSAGMFRETTIEFGLGAVVPLVLIVINFVRGPTCELRIQTAVQSERVMALSRSAKAWQAVEVLRPLILQAQEAEAAAAVAARTEPPASTAVPAPASDNPPAPMP